MNIKIFLALLCTTPTIGYAMKNDTKLTGVEKFLNGALHPLATGALFFGGTYLLQKSNTSPSGLVRETLGKYISLITSGYELCGILNDVLRIQNASRIDKHEKEIELKNNRKIVEDTKSGQSTMAPMFLAGQLMQAAVCFMRVWKTYRFQYKSKEFALAALTCVLPIVRAISRSKLEQVIN